MEQLLHTNDKIILTRKYIERIVGTDFINARHWEIFNDNFKIRFSLDRNETIASHFEWSIDEYDDLISRD
jgi:hypothetical protein